jgi:hypothetical protein
MSGAVHLFSNSEAHDGFDDFTNFVKGTAKAIGKSEFKLAESKDPNKT